MIVRRRGRQELIHGVVRFPDRWLDVWIDVALRRLEITVLGSEQNCLSDAAGDQCYAAAEADTDNPTCGHVNDFPHSC